MLPRRDGNEIEKLCIQQGRDGRLRDDAFTLDRSALESASDRRAALTART